MGPLACFPTGQPGRCQRAISIFNLQSSIFNSNGIPVASGRDVTNTPDAMKARTKTFALDVLEFVRGLPPSEPLRGIGRQLTRSATAVGANYRSACRSRSRSEFIARIGVVLEEADESACWFEILVEQRSALDRERATVLLDEADQLTAILAATRISASRGKGERKRD